MSRIENQVAALAVVVQSCYEVRQIATKNQYNNENLACGIKSIFYNNHPDSADVVFHMQEIQTGLQYIQHFFTHKDNRDVELIKMVALCMTLAKKLLVHKDMIKKLEQGIVRAQEQSRQFNRLHENVLANLSDLYQQTISTMEPRIMVSGNALFLQQKTNSDRIRVLLLCGIRCALMWYLFGGRKWHFFFQSGKIVHTARTLLKLT